MAAKSLVGVSQIREWSDTLCSVSGRSEGRQVARSGQGAGSVYLDGYPGLSVVIIAGPGPTNSVINTVWHKLVTITNTWSTNKQESNNICEIELSFVRC